MKRRSADFGEKPETWRDGAPAAEGKENEKKRL
jgi:hypothetical protein